MRVEFVKLEVRMATPKKNKGQFQPGNKASVGNEGGRPELYTSEWLSEEAKLLIEWFKQPRNIWLKGFALQRGYDPVRFDEFAEKSPEFSEALKKAKQWQEFKLVDFGLFNEINSGLTKFVLVNNHNWYERQQVDISADAKSLGSRLNEIDGQSKDIGHGRVD